MNHPDRRIFLKRLATLAGGVVLVPVVTSCSSGPSGGEEQAPAAPATTGPALPEVPLVRPTEWDPIAYNRERGNAGAIPPSYLPKINGPDGVTGHLGKHLPYVPEVDASLVPAGYVALMWGDPAKGYVRHPQAVRSEANNMEGHWYNWIRIRKAVDGEAEELQSRYSDWPGTAEGDNGAYAVFGDGEITADSGKNTIYLAALPGDVQPGDTVRIHAHCLTHGEYVDFLTL
ncbi:MAG: hypothetical protein Q9Q40_09860 [Acidobacteriota bacterium]|nr:hypothetical protein [Acidobacteriota bacterium]MDQ7088700.1 hypothetical protein [Acidobacteriota bacterium]